LLIQSNELVQNIRTIKGLNGNPSQFKIPIYTSENIKIGTLRPVDTILCKSPDVIEKLTSWRRTYMRYFLSQFPASEERTKNWLENVVLPSDNRILFLIYDNFGKAIGNIGACDIKPDEAELDNLIRGEIVDGPKFMFFAEIALLSWLYFQIYINTVVLHVFSNNFRAIKLYSQTGFSEKRRFNLSQIQDGEEVRYIVSSHSCDAVRFQYIEMMMSREQFELSQPWVKSTYVDQRLS
jgi:RimJ/RimL family protein N-acetyltransferase